MENSNLFNRPLKSRGGVECLYYGIMGSHYRRRDDINSGFSGEVNCPLYKGVPIY